MRWLSEARERLRGLVFRAREESEMDEELRFHLEMEAERLAREAGLDHGEARRRAAVAFGGMERYREEVREARGLAWVPGSWLDFKLGLRMLARYWGLTLIGGFAVAVAVAVGAVFFEIISEVLRPALPVEDGERVVSIQYATGRIGDPERRVLHDFAAWREELVTVEQLGAFHTVERNLATGDGPPESVEVAEITASGFRVARTPPLLGRYLVPDDERRGAPPVVVIGHEVWRSRFAGDPGVVGRTVELGGDPHVVVGVMPEGFEFPVSHRYWTPLRADPSGYGRLQGPELRVFGRLAPGATLEEARAELATVGRRTAAAHPGTYDRLRLVVLPFTRDNLENLDHPYVAYALRVLQALVGGLLVVVAVNLAILVYARTVARTGEIAVRSALGASRRRILAQLFLEALALSALGAAVGLALARFVLAWLLSRISIMDAVPFWIDFDLSVGTVLYAAGLAVLAAAIVGVLPGLKATGNRLRDRMGAPGGGTAPGLGRVWTTLIVTQVAIAVAVLPLAVFAVWQVMRMEATGPGFPAEEFVIATAELEVEDAGSGGAGEGGGEFGARLAARQRELTSRLEAEPGVSAVTFSSGVPGVEGVGRRVEFEGGSPLPGEGAPEAVSTRVAPGMFEVYGAEILAGRAFDAADPGGAANPVVVNRSFVRRVLGDRTALGRRFRYPVAQPDRPDAASPEWYEIVGVVEDFPAVPFEVLSAADGVPHVYHPAAPGEIHPVRLAVRFRDGVPADFARRFRKAAAEVDPALKVRTRPLTDFYRSLQSGSRAVAWGLALVTSSVLLLSAAGIYALMSFTVAQRTREIGIRAALGAHPRRILGSIFGRAMRQLGIGVLVGSVLSGAAIFAAGLQAERAAGLLLAVAAIMLGVGVTAAFGPALRGLRIQPTEALRADG